MTFRDELAALVNKHSRENESGTPDFILAAYIERCLENYEETVTDRERWYSRPVNTIGSNLEGNDPQRTR